MRFLNNIRNHYLLFLLMFVIIYLFYSQIYPYRLWRIEEDNFFVFTPDFTKSVLTSPAGVSEWIGLWLSQWYRNVLVGIIIHSLLITSIGVLSLFTFKRSVLSGGILGISVLPVAALIGASFYAHTPVIIVSQIMFWSSLLLYRSIKNDTLRLTIFSVLLPILFFLLPGGMLLSLYIILAIGAFIGSLRSVKSWMYILLVIIAASLPLVWNSFYFEPIGLRYTMFTNADVPDWITMIMLLSAILSISNLSKIRVLQYYWSYVIVSVQLLATCTLLYNNNVFRNAEESYHLEYLAENRMWSRIVKRGMDSEHTLYDLRMKYSVVGLVEMNKLPELLFSLPITSMFEYTYPEANSRMTYGLNRHFYKSLNLTNEAMRFLFQDACMSDYGMNFRVLRGLAECAKMGGDNQLANKYLSILSKSNQDIGELSDFVNSKSVDMPELPQLFCASTDINTLKRVISSQYSTTSINDCLLCYLLIKKELTTFAQVASLCLTSPDLVRGCYKEAALLCKVNNIPCNLEVSREALMAYDDLSRMIAIGDSESIEKRFKGSYLKYYFSDVSIKKV